DLLTETERTLLYRLSVFSGGWTLESAEAVCAGDGVAPEEIVELLAHLVDKSLVLVAKPQEDDRDAYRYRLLESMREYGWEKVVEADETHVLRARHLEHFLQFVLR